MFNKLINIKKFNSQIITIDELVNIVKNNPQTNIINEIRSTEYKSSTYNNLKLKINAITPHGIFDSLKNEDLKTLSGYLYYDIDNLDKQELEYVKRKLIETNIVCFICKSVGGRGLSFLIKYDTKLILNDTFTELYKYVRNILLEKGFNIDLSANGLVRKMIISSDNEVFYDNQVSLSIDKVSFKDFINELKTTGKSKRTGERKEDNDIILNDTFTNIIELEELYKQINIETLYTKEIDGDFTIEEMDYYKIILPKVIRDGTKHKLYIRIINALYYINGIINRNQIYSYLHHVNNRAYPKMNAIELQRLVNYVSNNIESTGEVLIKPRIKRLHFNNDSKLTKKQKQSMGGQLSAKLKTNKTLQLITEAKMKCAMENQIPTQKRIVEITGLSIATVKRNWNKNYVDLKDIKIKEETKSINNHTEIDVNDFLNKSEIINYKGFKSVEIDKITPEDKKLFISLVNKLKSDNIEPSEDIIVSLNHWCKYKSWFLYDKWLKSQKIKVEN